MSKTGESDEVTPECLVRDFYPYVRRLALTILDDGCPDAGLEAEDAAQEIIILAVRGLSNFRGDSSLKTWLTAITVNHCRGRLRKRQRTISLFMRLKDNHSTNHYSNALEETFLNLDRDRQLWISVDRLPEKQRLPVILHYVHDLTTAEIATVLALPEGTVHSRLYHARRKLQAMLEEQDG